MSRAVSQCWHVINTQTGEPWYDEHDTCEPSEAAAHAWASDILDDEYGDSPDVDPDGTDAEERAEAATKIGVGARPYRCVDVTCDVCGEHAETETGYTLHADPATVASTLADMEWRDDIAGQDVCEPCAAGLPPAHAFPTEWDQPLPGLEPQTAPS